MPRPRAASSRHMGFGRGLKVLLRQSYARHPSPIPQGLLSRYWLARDAFESYYRSSVFVFFFARRMVRKLLTRSLGRLNLMGFLLCHSALVDGQPEPRIQADEHPFYISFTRQSGVASPFRARQKHNQQRLGGTREATFAFPDTDSLSARCQNREGHSPLAIQIASFRNFLVMLLAG